MTIKAILRKIKTELKYLCKNEQINKEINGVCKRHQRGFPPHFAANA